jgi:hypothetical protein
MSRLALAISGRQAATIGASLVAGLVAAVVTDATRETESMARAVDAAVARVHAARAAAAQAAAAADAAADAARADEELVEDIAVERGQITAYGACDRPSASTAGALRRRVQHFIDSRVGTPAETDEEAIFFGCMEPGGIIVDARADRGQSGDWWVLRVTPDAIRVLAHARGTAFMHWMEWADERSVHTAALLDLDGDGALEAVLTAQAREGGAVSGSYVVRVARGNRTTVVGTLEGNLTVEGLEGDSLAVRTTAEPPDATEVRRCVGARGPWRRC